jgi:N12 class adenine-specific DNA methylase
MGMLWVYLINKGPMMSELNDKWLQRIQDQFDRVVDSVPYKKRMSESEKLRQQEIKNRKADIKKELDDLPNTKINEIDI